MVRKKASSSKNASVLASPAKVMMLQRNKSIGTPRGAPSPLLKTPVSYRSLSSSTPKGSKTLNKTTTKKRRARPGTRALQEIRRFQKCTTLLIPKLPFSRIVHEIVQSQPRSQDFRVSSMALMALQEAAEMAMVNMLEVANLCCLHANRVTLHPRDIHLTRRAFGLGHPINH